MTITGEALALAQARGTMPIAHSDLTKALLDISETGSIPSQREKINTLITATSGGVFPEGWDLSRSCPLPPINVNTGAIQGSAPQKPVGYRLGSASRNQLSGVHPQLVSCVMQAIAITTQDFTVYDGIRTLKEQAEYLKRGTTKTMSSLHLPQKDGFGHAVDLVPWIGGKAVWDWEGCYKIAAAMQQAATSLDIAHHIVWGGAWDRRLSDFGPAPAAFKQGTDAYGVRHAGPDFKDGPHFEWRD